MTTLAWHFLADSGLLRDRTTPPPDSIPLIYEGRVKMCESGLHFSRKPLDALSYAPGATVCRVAVDDIAEEHSDKGVCRKRTILWRSDATDTLHEFACWCAEQALALVKNPDPRSLAAIETKRRWLRGEATNEELAAAEVAAWAAAWAAGAAWAAARAAAGVARVAAWVAAWDAAWDAGAARAGARASQNQQLEKMLLELGDKQ